MNMLARTAIFAFAYIAIIVPSPTAKGQEAEPSASLSREADAMKGQVSQLRDAFVLAVNAAGLKCSIAPPSIDVQDVPSFGRYDPQRNVLTTAVWSQLSDEEKGLFLRRHPLEAEAREEFEIGVHHWVLVHELGHWWQACSGVSNNPDHFAAELGANRIAAAYWRKSDPSLLAHQHAVFESIVRRWSNPVPAGQEERAYFNANYDQLGPTPAYIWFQARMCLTAIDESSSLSLADALKQTASKP